MNFFEEFLFLDYIVLSLTIIFIILGIWKGFINSILSLLTWVGSIFITIYSYIPISEYLSNLLFNIEILADYEQFISILCILISVPLIFLISLFILKRIRKVLSSDIDKQVLGLIFDKIFGAVYGLIFSYVIFSSTLYFTNNDKLDTLYNLNLFFIENSLILNGISKYNKKIEEKYFSSQL